MERNKLEKGYYMVFLSRTLLLYSLIATCFTTSQGMQQSVPLKVTCLKDFDQEIKIMIALYLVDPNLKKSFFNLMRWACTDKKTYRSFMNPCNMRIFINTWVDQVESLPDLSKIFSVMAKELDRSKDCNFIASLINSQVKSFKLNTADENNQYYAIRDWTIREYIDDFMLLIYENDSENAKFLCKLGINLNELSIFNLQPLFFAHECAMQKLLLEHGANPNAQNEEGKTALIHVIQNNPKIVGSECNRFSLIKQLIEYKADVALADKNSITPLHYAVHEHRVTTVEQLISAGAPINAQDIDGYTPLFQSIRDVIFFQKKLLEEKANRQISPDLFLKFEMRSEPSIIELLLKRGADPSIQDNKGNTPLAYAQEQNKKEICKLLCNQ